MLGKLPPPTNFAEGQRARFGLLMVLFGIWSGVLSLAMTVFFGWLAFKLPAHQVTILYVLAGALAANQLGTMIVMVSMAVGGPVGRFRVSANKDGASLEASDDNEPPSASVTMTAQVETP